MNKLEVSEIPEALMTWLSDPRVLLVFAIVLSTMIVNFLVRRGFDRLYAKAESTTTIWDDALLASVRKPLRLMIWVVGVGWAAEMIAKQSASGFEEIINPLRYVLVLGILVYFLVRFIREVEKGLVHNGSDATTTHAVGKLLRVSVIVTAVLSILQTLGISISGILAFGGFGGIAVGFAAKDLLANFFGGLMIYLDRPFALGDWIRSPDREIEGTVENIGWRLTVIRTFDMRPLYIPNSVFANIAVENPSRMKNRRIYETIGVRYEDAALLAKIVEDVETMLRADADIDQDQTMMVNFNEFADSSLNFFIYTFTRTTNWVEFHQVKQRVLLDVFGIIESHGAECAFPTSTVHLDAGGQSLTPVGAMADEVGNTKT
ncbi:mechanosensitive ion channel family protein [Pseudomonadales bacterium]|jgi:MscS family membrane protein|nr:mechanosensitive ion channel family protein [Pseudomonadales bacterium]MDC1480122.1 mechanosensitive ion channel family protein [Pseudomonadales bacterium]